MEVLNLLDYEKPDTGSAGCFAAKTKAGAVKHNGSMSLLADEVIPG